MDPLFPRLNYEAVVSFIDKQKVEEWLAKNKDLLKGMLILDILGIILHSNDEELVAAATRLAEAGELEDCIENWLLFNGFKIGLKPVTLNMPPAKKKSTAKVTRKMSATWSDGDVTTKFETAYEGLLLKTKLDLPNFLSGNNADFASYLKYSQTQGFEDKKPFEKFKLGTGNKISLGKFQTEVFLGVSAKEKEFKQQVKPEFSIKAKQKYGLFTGSVEFDLQQRFAAGIFASSRSGVHKVGTTLRYDDQNGSLSHAFSYGVSPALWKKDFQIGLRVQPDWGDFSLSSVTLSFKYSL